MDNINKKHALILLADGFEEIEALTCHDVFLRTGRISPTLMSVSDKLEVSTSSGLTVIAEARLSSSDPKYYDFIVLPGGKRGVDNLSSNEKVIDLLKRYHAEGKHIHAICAAPSILGKLGFLDGKNYTCFPGFQQGKGNYVDTGAVTDGTTVTGHSMGYSLDFAKAIVKLEVGEDALEAALPGIYGL